MLSKQIEIRNSIGLHARPASMLAAEASKYQSNVFIKYGSCFADLKNSVRVLAMAINCGEVVELMVMGSDEEQAFHQIAGIFEAINRNDC